jgi:hypothetical protein
MATVSTTIDLDATPATVWGALTTTDDYPTWNPFIRRLEGWLTPGSKLTVRIEPPGGKPMTFTPAVTEVSPERRLAWLGRFLLPGLFGGAHSFTLEPFPTGVPASSRASRSPASSSGSAGACSRKPRRASAT